MVYLISKEEYNRFISKLDETMGNGIDDASVIRKDRVIAQFILDYGIPVPDNYKVINKSFVNILQHSNLLTLVE